METKEFVRLFNKKLNEKYNIIISDVIQEKLQEGTTPISNNLDSLKDTKGIMDALLINYFGFLGLFSMRITGAFKKYEETEGNLEHPTAISFEDNHDVSFCVKKAHDIGLLDDAHSSRMLRILAGIKSKEIKDKTDLCPNAIRRLLDAINYFEHSPSKEVYDIIFRFHESGYTLSKTTNLLFQLAKTPDYANMTTEFRKLAAEGQYSRLFKSDI